MEFIKIIKKVVSRMAEYYVFTVSFDNGVTEDFGCLKKENNVEIAQQDAEQELITALFEDGHEDAIVESVRIAHTFPLPTH